MKQTVKLYNNNTILYEGRISDIPIRPESIIDKSVELFDDDDPCIIHQSYVIKHYVDDILGLFERMGSNELVVADYPDQLSFLDLPDDSGWLLKRTDQ